MAGHESNDTAEMVEQISLAAALPSPPATSQVMWIEGIIVLMTIACAVLVVYCCMHQIDTPTRFASGDSRRGGAGHPHAE